ncbi:hypothetical protein BGW38_007072 [Lunasporangiospora selenospora]|uniref:SWIRM domain-containing protein n=1 Tax=Lunasporangiospora selenospora TaxID=979761 RepID=A0A9P6KAD7_9FUNG|nr:hypothetical protein BGW38_007072 [Lunasporangiospora selenospora]
MAISNLIHDDEHQEQRLGESVDRRRHSRQEVDEEEEMAEAGDLLLRLHRPSHPTTMTVSRLHIASNRGSHYDPRYVPRYTSAPGATGPTTTSLSAASQSQKRKRLIGDNDEFESSSSSSPALSVATAMMSGPKMKRMSKKRRELMQHSGYNPGSSPSTLMTPTTPTSPITTTGGGASDLMDPTAIRKRKRTKKEHDPDHVSPSGFRHGGERVVHEPTEIAVLDSSVGPTSVLDTMEHPLPMVIWKGQPLSVVGKPGYELLHEHERKIASTLRLSPAHPRGPKKQFRKSDAQKLCRIDVNKTSQLWEVFAKLGWLAGISAQDV